MISRDDENIPASKQKRIFEKNERFFWENRTFEFRFVISSLAKQMFFDPNEWFGLWMIWLFGTCEYLWEKWQHEEGINGNSNDWWLNCHVLTM